MRAVEILREKTAIPRPDAAERERAAMTLAAVLATKPYHVEQEIVDAYDVTLAKVTATALEAEAAVSSFANEAKKARDARDEVEAARALAADHLEKAKAAVLSVVAQEKRKEATLLTAAVADAESAKVPAITMLLGMGAAISRNEAAFALAEQVRQLKSGSAADSAGVIARRCSANLSWPEPSSGDRSSVDVLDSMIAALRHAEIRAIESDGAGATSVAKVRSALAAAYQQRSGMVDLRPTSTYLRTSYAVSSLGTSAATSGRNLLDDSAFALLPIGDWFGGSKSREQRERIDAQFWQSVNHVGLSGGGHTNYAVVKDDIGNWYVKGFAGDPTKIYESVKNVALFNAGGGVAGASAALLRRGGNAAAIEALGTDGGTGGSVLDQQLERAQTAWEKSTRELRVDVRAMAVAIGDEVRAAWKGDRELDDRSVELDAALAVGAPGLADAQAAIPDPEALEATAGALVDGLLAVKRFRHAVAKALDEGIVGPKRKSATEARGATTAAEEALDAARAKELEALKALNGHRDAPTKGDPETPEHQAWRTEREALVAAATSASSEASRAEAIRTTARETESERVEERDDVQADADRAVRVLTELIRGKLDERIRKREKAIVEYEAAIAVISGVATE
jgi:hypothetical protein